VNTTSAPPLTTVLSERHGPVLLLTLNRPERLNAWNGELERRYFDLLEEADNDPEVRAVVVTGAGRGFCAGADMQDLQRIAGADLSGMQRSRPQSFPLTVRKPLIAALNGAAAGLGFVQALYCDLRFSVADAKLTTAFARRGLVAEYGLSWMLPRLIGTSAAFDLLMSARVVLGEEALRLGLVDRVVEPERLLEEAIAYARDLSEHCSPTSISIIKAQLRSDLEVDFATAYEASERLMAESLRRPDLAEGVASYLERRAPAFSPLPVRS
jgi:enoyl-CoA hydratase/carnithine racemase